MLASEENLINTPTTIKSLSNHNQTNLQLPSHYTPHKGQMIPNSQRKETPPPYWKVFATVSFYLIAALIMIFVNKWVLRETSIPLSFLLFQLLLAVVFLEIGFFSGFLKSHRFSWSTARSLLPLILINVIGLVLNTYCLQKVEASFYQIARGLILPFTVFGSFLFLRSVPSHPILLAVSTVCFGFFWGVKSEDFQSSRSGIIFGILSSITTASHAVIVKRSFSVTSSPIELAYYNNFFSSILLLPVLIISGEIKELLNLLTEGGKGAESLKTFMIGGLVTGLFGFLICLAGFLSIKVTSPTSHMISSSVRGVIQTFLGNLFFKDVISIGRMTGIGFILLGSVGYTAIKDHENQNQRNKKCTKNELYYPISKSNQH
ncbi:hypothetical protein BY996DRAFT_6429203 [Phakopsora pachyrhizi]|nr:hypothetical protein BY996DRAFT_6429203 [Phakopsora pachyrhizi]